MGSYWMKGIVNGYLYLSPFEAFTLAIIMQTISRTARNATIGIPMIMIQSGAARIM